MIVIRPRNYRPPDAAGQPAGAADGSREESTPAENLEEAGEKVSMPSSAVAAVDAVPKPALDDDLKARLQTALGERFEVLSRYAIGGMATLYLIRHRLHGGLFVAKVLQPELAGDPGLRRRSSAKRAMWRSWATIRI